MTPAQYAQLRGLLSLIAGALATAGYFRSSAVEPIVGIVMYAATMAWSWWKNSPTQMIADTNQLDNVKLVVTDQKTADAIPSATVVAPHDVSIANGVITLKP